MKKILITLITINIFSCTKYTEKQSQEVVIEIEKASIARITFLTKKDTSYYQSELFDTDYIKQISFKIEAGEYIIKAETQQKTKYLNFTKTDYKHHLIIEL
jgi:hypothetical protein